MRKYSFLVHHAAYNDFLLQLRGLGVLHVLTKKDQVYESDEMRDCLEKCHRLSAMQRFLSPLKDKDAPLLPADRQADGMLCLEELEALLKQQSDIQLKKQSLQKEIDHVSVWGDFDYASIDQLAKQGCQIDFFVCPKSAYQSEWEAQYHAIPINEDGSRCYFICCSLDGSTPDIQADRVRLPHVSLSALQAEMQSLCSRLETIDQRLRAAASEQVNTLKLTEQALRDRYQFSKVICDTEKTAGDRLMLLEGYVPQDKEAELQSFLQQANVYYQAADAYSQEADVPIKLKNNWFSKLYEPITKMYSLPNYTELDPTPFLAPFFMLFFGFCMGDGGYGLLILLACTLFKNKLSESMRPLCTLGQTLGLSTLLVGILTGAFFGMSLDAVEWSWLKNVKHLFLTQANYGDSFGGYNPMMFVAIGVGVIQILYGMFINVAKITKQRGFKYALSNLSWALLIISLMVCFGLPMLGVMLPTAVLYALYACMGVFALLIVFYNSPDKNIFINVGSSLWDTYNMASGLLGDVLSYIRLFALGLTGSILGGVFNTMAFDMTGGLPPYVRWLAVLAILLVGHAINFALAMIGALVHPMRLTFVEFYKNSGFEGGGKTYDPFRKTAE